MNVSHFSNTLNEWLTNLADTGRGKKQAVSALFDALACAAALWMAYSLRLGTLFSDFSATFHIFLLLPILTVAIFGALGIYRWVVRSTNKRLLKQIVKAVLVSSALLVILLFVMPPDRINPRSIVALYAVYLIGITAGMRLIWQSLFDVGHRGEPVAIYGAGAAGRQLASHFEQGHEYRAVAFIDDNSSLKNASMVLGLPVVRGDEDELATKLARFEVRRVIIAIPSIDREGYQRVLRRLSGLNVPIKTIPDITELVMGRARADEIRDVSIGDILGRPEVPPDAALLGRCVTGKNVLVTGGGGSIGAELCRQIAVQQPACLVALDNCEANLYYLTEEFENDLKAGDYPAEFRFEPVLCSVTDAAEMQHVISTYGINTVYHAAAYKHVPILERQPEQGIDTNILGTLVTLDAAIAHGVESFVLISTDKAVRPANVLGASKRVAELILQAKARLTEASATTICMVRFGNVLGSSGSVVPKFKKQILAGGPVTVTHPDITRFFMTISEAAQLVLQAGAIAKGGEVFVLDMGKPILIRELAEAMIRLYGRKLKRVTGDHSDIEILYEGLRPGEKLYEEMFITDKAQTTEVPKVFKADEHWLDWKELESKIGSIVKARHSPDRNSQRIKSLLLHIALNEAGFTEKPLTEIQVDYSNGSLEELRAV